jgi:hypothetical protein
VRTVVRVVLALCIVVGVVWMGQGAGLVPGSFMTGRAEWAVIGTFLAGGSAIALWWTTQRR